MRNNMSIFEVAQRLFRKGLSSDEKVLKLMGVDIRWWEKLVREEAGSDYFVGMECDVSYYVRYLERQVYELEA